MIKNPKKTIIYFASTNKNKLKEIKNILKELKLYKIILKSAPDNFEVNENGKTFLENATKKAKALSLQKKTLCFADDSGIEVNCMNGNPGIKSARFFKNGKGMKTILNKTKKSKNKKCNFTCAIVLTNENGKVIYKVQKKWFGIIADKVSGGNGFGYDPIFFIPKLGLTSAELKPKEKDKLSHRGQAVREFGCWLRKNYAL